MGEPSTSQVRAWARSQGLEVSDRGRLPASITRAYQEAHAVKEPVPVVDQVPDGVAPAPAPDARQPAWPAGRAFPAPAGWPLDPPEAPPPGTNGWSVAALVLGLLGIGPVAIACGLVGFTQARRTGQAGRRIAISGVVLGVLGTIAVVALVLLDTPAQRDDNGAVVTSGTVPLADLRTGDCLTELPFDRPGDPIAVQPCQGLHAAEVFFAFDPAGADYPGSDALRRVAESRCDEVLRRTDFAAPIETYALLTIVPTRERWEEADRRTHCLITGASNGTLTDSELGPPGG